MIVVEKKKGPGSSKPGPLYVWITLQFSKPVGNHLHWLFPIKEIGQLSEHRGFVIPEIACIDASSPCHLPANQRCFHISIRGKPKNISHFLIFFSGGQKVAEYRRFYAWLSRETQVYSQKSKKIYWVVIFQVGDIVIGMTAKPIRTTVFAAMCLLMALFKAPAQDEPAQTREVGKVFNEIRSALFSNNPEKALEIAGEAIKKYPDRPEPYFFRARVWDYQRQFGRAVEDLNLAISKDKHIPDIWQLRGIAHFQLGEASKSVADFDEYLKLRPREAPYHWQRGISLYYAEAFQKGADQFTLHKSVNATDVENVFWHFICLAKATSPENARKNLIPLQPGDSRIPMPEVHKMLLEELKPEEVIKAAEKAGLDNPAQRTNYLCYAHMYVGLYHEALGRDRQAAHHMELAAVKYRQFHYMGDVARVHYLLLKKKEKKAETQKSKEVPGE